MPVALQGDGWRRLEPEWDVGLIAASIAISLLGAFTSTQLMCQARMSTQFSSVFVWTLLGSLTFGFCSIWCLHFVAMLACGLDLPIGIDVPLTLLSSILAVLFTFAALASDLLWDRYGRRRRKKRASRRRKALAASAAFPWEESSKPFLQSPVDEHEPYNDEPRIAMSPNRDFDGDNLTSFHAITPPESPQTLTQNSALPYEGQKPVAQSPPFTEDENFETAEADEEESVRDTSSEQSSSRRTSSFMGSNHSSYGLGGLSGIMHLAHRGASPTKNAFIATGEALYAGCTRKNTIKGFMWSLAITSMHYVGIAALVIPNGDFTLEPFLVVLSGLISWVVCLVGCILMSQIETHLTQQCLFSAVASIGVAAMHFTGKCCLVCIE